MLNDLLSEELQSVRWLSDLAEKKHSFLSPFEIKIHNEVNKGMAEVRWISGVKVDD